MLEFLPGFMYTMYTWFLIADCKYSNGDCMQARDCWWFSTVAVSTLEGTKSLKCSSYTICLTPVLNMIITLTCWSVCWLAFCFFYKQVVLTVLAVLQYRQGVSVGSVYGSGSDSYTDTGASPFWCNVRQWWSFDNRSTLNEWTTCL